MTRRKFTSKLKTKVAGEITGKTSQYFMSSPWRSGRLSIPRTLLKNLNGKIRKYTKNKLSFPTDEAVTKISIFVIKGGNKKVDDAFQELGYNPQPVLNYS